MPSIEYFQGQLATFVRNLGEDDRRMLVELARGLGVEFLRVDDSAQYTLDEWALYWELTMRLTPLLQEQAFGSGEFGRHCNPFFDAEVVAPFQWSSHFKRREPGEADTLLREAYYIEHNHYSDWPHAGAIAENYLGLMRKGMDGDETFDQVDAVQAYLSRIVLRGEQESTVAALHAHFNVALDNARRTEDSLGAMNCFVDDVLPVMAYAFTRIREHDLSHLVGLYADTAREFLKVILSYAVNGELDGDVRSSRPYIWQLFFRRIDLLGELVNVPSNFFPLASEIEERQAIAYQFVSTFSLGRPLGVP